MMYRKLISAFILLLATTAFASNKASCTLAQTVTVSGHQLAPGEYQFQWEGTGPSINLNILSKGKLITTVPAQMVEQSSATEKTTMRMRENNDGSRSLSQINFAGKKYALTFGEDTAAIESPAPGNGKTATSKP